MGKMLIIKGADFSKVALDKVEKTTDITASGVRVIGKVPGRFTSGGTIFDSYDTSSVWDCVIYDVSEYQGKTLRFTRYKYKASAGGSGDFDACWCTAANETTITNGIGAELKTLLYDEGDAKHAFGFSQDVVIPQGKTKFICIRMNETLESTNVDNDADVPFVVGIVN